MEYCVCSLQQMLDNCPEKMLPEFQVLLFNILNKLFNSFNFPDTSLFYSIVRRIGFSSQQKNHTQGHKTRKFTAQFGWYPKNLRFGRCRTFNIGDRKRLVHTGTRDTQIPASRDCLRHSTTIPV
jgi:hypothetical protein